MLGIEGHEVTGFARNNAEKVAQAWEGNDFGAVKHEGSGSQCEVAKAHDQPPEGNKGGTDDERGRPDQQPPSRTDRPRHHNKHKMDEEELEITKHGREAKVCDFKNVMFDLQTNGIDTPPPTALCERKTAERVCGR